MLPCDYLPLEKPPQPETSKKSSNSKKKSHERVIRDAEDESSDDEESLQENFLPVMLTQDLSLDIDNSTDVETCSLVESEPAVLQPPDEPESVHEAELQEPEEDELEPELNEPEETQENDENLAIRPQHERCPPSILMYDRSSWSASISQVISRFKCYGDATRYSATMHQIFSATTKSIWILPCISEQFTPPSSPSIWHESNLLLSATLLVSFDLILQLK